MTGYNRNGNTRLVTGFQDYIFKKYYVDTRLE